MNSQSTGKTDRENGEPSDLQEEATERSFRHAVRPKIEEHYPAETFPKLMTVCGVDGGVNEDAQVNFIYELDQIISGYKRRFADESYFEKMSSCRDDLKSSGESMERAIGVLSALDFNHWKHIFLMLELLVPKPLRQELPRLDVMELLRMLKRSSLLAQCVSSAIDGAGTSEIGPRTRGRRTLPYLWPTLDLMEFWYSWSGRPVTFAKLLSRKHGKAKGTPENRSTEFIFAALKFIDPKVTVANAVTAINSGRKFRETSAAIEFGGDLEGAARLLKSLADPED